MYRCTWPPLVPVIVFRLVIFTMARLVFYRLDYCVLGDTEYIGDELDANPMRKNDPADCPTLPIQISSSALCEPGGLRITQHTFVVATGEIQVDAFPPTYSLQSGQVRGLCDRRDTSKRSQTKTNQRQTAPFQPTSAHRLPGP